MKTGDIHRESKYIWIGVWCLIVIQLNYKSKKCLPRFPNLTSWFLTINIYFFSAIYVYAILKFAWTTSFIKSTLSRQSSKLPNYPHVSLSCPSSEPPAGRCVRYINLITFHLCFGIALLLISFSAIGAENVDALHWETVVSIAVRSPVTILEPARCPTYQCWWPYLFRHENSSPLSDFW